MADESTVIEGEYCRMHLEEHLWQLRSVSGTWQGQNCLSEDIEQAQRLVNEYDERIRGRIRLAEQERNVSFTDEELIKQGRNPIWVQMQPQS